jgi:uncharacterized protein
MKTIVGSPARKERFFKRPDIRSYILTAIKNGENLLISAPRRIGKSSILLDLVDNPDEDLYAVFIDTEAIEDADQFFKLVIEAILHADHIEEFGHFNGRTKNRFTEWLNRVGRFKIGPVEVGIEKAEKLSYYTELNNFLTDINLEGKKILLLVDEFPITVEKIQEKHGLQSARHFLSQNRALRQNPLFQEKIKFIYTGSIGLFTAVKKIDATDKINDLREIRIPALQKQDALQLLKELMREDCPINYSPETEDYILQKLEWWIPFYFQCMVRELYPIIITEGRPLDNTAIDEAFKNIAKNGNIYFEHFKSRLKKVFKPEELKMANRLLVELKEQPCDYRKSLNLAIKYKVRDEHDNILEVLKHDGYIVEENDLYKFYSPILKQWWK